MVRSLVLPSRSLVVTAAPTRNRSSGESVRTSTASSPRIPCALAMRPTTTSMTVPKQTSAVGVDDVHADASPTDATHDGAQGGRRATTPADHLAEVVGVHVHLERAATARGQQLDPDLVRVVDDPAHQVLEGVREETHSDFSPSAASAFSAFFGADFFFGVVASVEGSSPAAASAALNRSCLDGFGSATFRVPSAPGRPLNFCQSPVISSRRWTGSVGCAPTFSQYWARSETTSIRLGSSFGWYLPIVSMALPSRRVRASATMMR